MIKIDIEMPKNCDVCMFSQWSNLSQTASCKLKDYEPCFDDFSKEYKSKRASFCPLHEVTECTDMVSRQAVLDAVDGLKKWSLLDKYGQHVGVGVFCNEIKTKVKDLPSSPTPSRPQWIPVTERLPEHSCQTLVTTKWDTEYSVEYGFYWGEDNKWGTITNNVIAWMPLPEPYHRP